MKDRFHHKENKNLALVNHNYDKNIIILTSQIFFLFQSGFILLILTDFFSYVAEMGFHRFESYGDFQQV